MSPWDADGCLKLTFSFCYHAIICYMEHCLICSCHYGRTLFFLLKPDSVTNTLQVLMWLFSSAWFMAMFLICDNTERVFLYGPEYLFLIVVDNLNKFKSANFIWYVYLVCTLRFCVSICNCIEHFLKCKLNESYNPRRNTYYTIHNTKTGKIWKVLFL